jgi:hypothetical protein
MEPTDLKSNRVAWLPGGLLSLGDGVSFGRYSAALSD